MTAFLLERTFAACLRSSQPAPARTALCLPRGPCRCPGRLPSWPKGQRFRSCEPVSGLTGLESPYSLAKTTPAARVALSVMLPAVAVPSAAPEASAATPDPMATPPPPMVVPAAPATDPVTAAPPPRPSRGREAAPAAAETVGLIAPVSRLSAPVFASSGIAAPVNGSSRRTAGTGTSWHWTCRRQRTGSPC